MTRQLCDCQAHEDGLFLDRHESTCATNGGPGDENRTPQPTCGRMARSPLHRTAVLYCGVTGDHTTHIAHSLSTGAPVWEWEQGQPARPVRQKREAA